jgi:hypothetical protein
VNRNIPFFDFVLLIPTTIAILIIIHHFREKNYKHIFYLLLSWVCYSIWLLANGLGMAYSEEIYVFISIYMTIPLAYSLVLFFDSITKEHYGRIKLCIISFLSAMKIVYSLEEDAITRTVRDGELYLEMSINLSLAGVALMIFVTVTYIFYMGKIFVNCPRNLKAYSLISLIGSIIMAIEPLSALFDTGFPIPIFITIGTILTLFSFISIPQLAFILPFKASSLFVFNNESGIPLYSYHWDKREANELSTNLLPPMLQGISGVLRECVNKGLLQGVHLDNAYILLKRSKFFVCAIITTKSSPSLSYALNAFSEAFSRKYDSLNGSLETSKFDESEEIVEKYFNFVPKYT